MKVNPAEYTLCAWVEFAFQSLTAVIDWCLRVMQTELMALISALNQIYRLMEQQIRKAIDTMTDIINNCIEAAVNKISEDDLEWLKNVRNSFCEMLARCEFVVDILAHGNRVSDDTWLDYTNLQSLDTPPYFAELHDPYIWLRKVVCNFSLKDLVKQAGELSKEMLSEKLHYLLYGNDTGTWGLSWAVRKASDLWDDWNSYIHKPLNKIIPFGLFKSTWNSLFGWIPTDMNSYGLETDPSKMNIFDLMALLEKLTDCAFSICNFATSVLTYKQDKKTKMYIDWETELPIPPTALTGLRKLEYEMNQLSDSWLSGPAKTCLE